MTGSSSSNFYEAIDPAMSIAAKLNEEIADESRQLDRSAKTRLRKEVNRLKDMMDQVMKFEEDAPDAIEGMKEVIMNTEARLDGQPMHFKADEGIEQTETHYSQAA